MAKPRVSLIAALARNLVIGRDNGIPWHLPDDLKRFKQLTLGHPLVMGRKTFESILAIAGKPLPGRESIVVTRSARYSPPGCRIVPSLDAALAAAGANEVFVIGGGELYALAMPLAERLYLTEIDADFEGDTLFPRFERAAWTEISREHRELASTGLRYDFVVYERRARGAE
jgi:dihydrofolate reductase